MTGVTFQGGENRVLRFVVVGVQILSRESRGMLTSIRRIAKLMSCYLILMALNAD